MQEINSYCKAVEDNTLSQLHIDYHNTEYGFSAKSDNELFGRMLLEINQAGLSWNTILNKRETLKQAYAGFDISKVAKFNEQDEIRLLNDPGIIRMKLKIKAAIYNAKKIMEIQQEFGSFESWLDKHHPKTADEWIKLFKKTFKFMGKEITKEFLMSASYLEGAHSKSCPVYEKTIRQKPKWYSG